MTYSAVSIAILWGFLFPAPQQECSLVIHIQPLEVVQGSVHLGLYDDMASFTAQQHARAERTIPVHRLADGSIIIDELTPGTYAVGGYQDINNNRKLDTNLLGIPTEPYGFSRDPKAKWKAPTFAETVITLKSGQNEITLKLASWAKR